MALKATNKINDILHFEDIGDVKLQISNRSKYMRIKLHPDKGTSLIIPGYYKKEAAIKFLLSKKDWILKKLDKQKSLNSSKTIFLPETNFKTYERKLEIKRHKRQTLKCHVNASKISVWYPENVKPEHEKVQVFIRRTIEETYRIEAKKYVPQWVNQLAQQHGFIYNQVRIKNTKTRWGSCSSKKNLNFTLHIMRIPVDLRNYLILHELTHTKVPNHAKEFWEKLEKCLPYAKQLDKKLNSYHLEIW